MTYELIIEIAFKSFVTSGLALLLLALLKDRSAGERSWIAHIGLVATVILPLATIYMPKWYIESPAPGAAAPAAAAADLAAPAAGITPAVAPIEPQMTIDFGSIAFWFYALVAAALLLVTLLAVVRLFMLRGTAAVLVEPKWLSALAHAQRRMGFKHGTALLVSNALDSPVSWGVLRPIILLNEESVSSQAEAEAIIAHELAHVAHLDWAKLLVARAATALFWFNPLVWLLARQCHQLREEAADDAVLLSNVPNTDYAALLIGAARHDNKGTLLAANGVAPGRGSLKRRVTRVLDAKLQRAPARMGWGAACTLAGMIVAAPLSAVTAVTPPASLTGTSAPPAPARPAPFALVAEAAASSARQAIASAASVAAVAPPETMVAPAAPSAHAAAPSEVAAPASGVPDPAPAAIETTVNSAVTAALAEVKQKLGPEFLARTRSYALEEAKWGAKVAQDVRSGLPTPDQLIALRIHRISPEYIRQLADAGYPNLPQDQLMSAGVHRVTPEYIREIAQAGYPGLTMPQLISLRIHRVSPSFIKGLAAAGHANLSYKELVNAAVHRVTPEFIKGMAASGYQGLSMNQLVAMRIHRVSPEFVEEMRSLGYHKLPAGQLIEKRVEKRVERGAGGGVLLREPPALPLPPHNGVMPVPPVPKAPVPLTE